MPPTRTRKPRSTASTTLTEVSLLVDALVKENRSLKRQLAKLEAAGVTAPARGRTANPVATGLTRLNRKLRSALAEAAPARARIANRTAKTSVPRKPRKPVSPEVAARRLEALAKARAVRAARKAAAAAAN